MVYTGKREKTQNILSLNIFSLYLHAQIEYEEQIIYKFFDMKNSNYIINGILIVAIALFILNFTSCKQEKTKNSETSALISDSTGLHLPIAFIRTDSLLPKYKFFNDLNDAYIKKAEDKRLDLNRRADKWTKDVTDYTQKAQMNAFLSQERQAQEQEKLYRQRDELDKLSNQVAQEMQVEQAKVFQQIQDTIIVALKEFNTPKKYELILSNAGTDNILYADDTYDITNAVLEFLNARYVPAK